MYSEIVYFFFKLRYESQPVGSVSKSLSKL